ncbi:MULTISPECIES: SHOCT domain-containing protein [Kitasatospora]|jgi:putative membrane protein|uniref:SHOCT domain-containing protein n=1 Tax=Kitasatospora TaxID=2063 RepID=UPI000C70B051|nr:SHOCT domain-containing protein [Kitasatospora sp. GP30]MDH6142252.1 putative membrane protein [Kitasatospora sp. GP30]
MFVRHFHHVGGYGGYGPGFWLFVIGFVVLAVLFVVLITTLARGSRVHRSTAAGSTAGAARAWSTGTAEAERILAERYARGELDDEEYQRRLRTLREPPSE